MPVRDYDDIAARLTPAGPRDARMRAVVDALWDALHAQGVSWVGFYVEAPDAPDDRRLVLGPSRDTPACSPIGVHGVCGQSYTRRVTRIVRDVATLGPDYIACDPRDRSEIVVPVSDGRGGCDAVLDLDSWDVGAFDASDDAGLRRVLARAGIGAVDPPA